MKPREDIKDEDLKRDKMYLKYSDLVLAKKLGVFVYSNFRKIKFLYLASAWSHS
jgi:hypothetical protein